MTRYPAPRWWPPPPADLRAAIVDDVIDTGSARRGFPWSLIRTVTLRCPR